MKPYVKIALVVVLLIAIGSILAALVLYNKKQPDTSKIKPDITITATDLQKEFENNEKTASDKYINKILEVSGTITAVTPADSANTNISLKTANEMSAVNCAFQKYIDPTKFKAGDLITLRGVCSGFLMDVLLKNCSVIPEKK
jgi:tRNA_anti-like